MAQSLANFCRERARQCREASESAPTEALRSYWREAEARWHEAEAQWLERFAGREPSEAEAEDINLGRSSQEEPIPLSSTPEGFAPAITFERFAKWFEMVRANVLMRHSPTPEDPALYRERAHACRKAADSAENADAKQYWLAAEAYWLSLVVKVSRIESVDSSSRTQ